MMDIHIFRRTLFLFIPIFLVVVGVSYTVYSLTMDKHRAITASIGQRHVEKAQRQIAHELDSVLKDLTFLALIHESYDIFNGSISRDLKDTFMTLSYNRKVYDQVRYLDINGQEIFRINNTSGSPRIAFDDELQFKGDRYYFKNSIGLRLDEIYISPLDLNVEHGAIEEPHKPMLRLASPIADADGVNVGALIINFLGAPLLDALVRVTVGTDDTLLLLNKDGFSLKGESPDREWGFMFNGGDGPSFAKEHGPEWERIVSTDNGQFSTEQGLFTFATVDLRNNIYESTQLRGNHIAPLWKVVSWTPALTLENLSSQTISQIFLYSGPILLLALFFSGALAVHRTRRALAEELVLKQIESNARFVPREFLGLLDKGELTDVAISDHVERSMTILFTDIRSYTKISESMTPRQVLIFLNDYYQILDPIISRNGGFIDAFIGDAVMALFPSGADGAVQAAIDISIALRDFKYRSGSMGKEGFDTGFGLHCGEVTLGAVGSERRMQTTAIGDAVNLAARIESCTKLFGVNIIVSEQVYDQLSNKSRFKIRNIDRVRVKGKQEVVELYEVFDSRPAKELHGKLDSLEIFNEAMRHYREGDFQAAIDKLTRCQELCPEDTLPAIYIKRSNTMLRIPPGKEWAGVSTV